MRYLLLLLLAGSLSAADCKKDDFAGVLDEALTAVVARAASGPASAPAVAHSR